MSTYCSDVRQFHDKFGLVTPPSFVFISQELFEFRVKFFYEEFQEYGDSVISHDLGSAVDALIDLVYITCGCALLHGIDERAFESNLSLPSQPSLFVNDPNFRLGWPTPNFMSRESDSSFVRHLKTNIENYVDAYMLKDEVGVKTALAALYLNCLTGSIAIGLSTDQWDEMWKDVQKANMAKVRASSALDSKRGSSFDVVKPIGWTPPRTQELISKYLGVKNAV